MDNYIEATLHYYNRDFWYNINVFRKSIVNLMRKMYRKSIIISRIMKGQPLDMLMKMPKINFEILYIEATSLQEEMNKQMERDMKK